MFDTIRLIFERFGFLPLDTPGIEREEVLTGGDPNFKMQIFKTGLRTGDEGLALRFDLTIPLARVVSLYSDKLEKPFKRYQTGKVWRGEKPQAGRFREFIQFDADIVGSSKLSADSEIISLIYETLKALSVERFIIKINNRKILDGLPVFIGYKSENNIEILRTLDKLDKIGRDGVMKELEEKMQLTKDQIGKLTQFLDLQSESGTDTLDKLSILMKDSPDAMKGISELLEISRNLNALKVPNNIWKIDLSVARGLGYYTGPVFETILLDIPSIGSVFSGGRYDDLVARFGQQSIPATGASVGVDRLFAAMEKLGLLKKEKGTAKVVVLNFDPSAELYCQQITSNIRAIGVPTEIYLGKETMLKGQLAYALNKEAPVIIIAGGNEVINKTVQIKDTKNRKQIEVPLSMINETIEKILGFS
jgi:histidyl-tRNA synthetase